MTTTKQWVFLNILTSLPSSRSSSSSSSLSFMYAYDTANQGICTALVDGSDWFYDYNALGQARSGHKYWRNGGPTFDVRCAYYGWNLSAFDGNGIVTALANAGSTNVLAQYGYGPFGEVIGFCGTNGQSEP